MSVRIVVKGWVPKDETPNRTIRAMWKEDKNKIADILQDLVWHTKQQALKESKEVIRRRIVCTFSAEDV